MQLIGLVVPADFEVSSFAPLSVFESANAVLGERRYVTRLLSSTGGAVSGSFGIEVITHPLGEPACDTLFVAGTGTASAEDDASDFLLEACDSARRIAATRRGTFALAELGLLDGRRVTAHWEFASEFKERFPQVRFEDDSIFVEDGSIWTSAGMTAGVDLAMQLLERDIGPAATQKVASQMVVGQRRYARHQQRPATTAFEPKSDRIQMALTHARANLRSALTVEEMADAACLSPRQFTRLFGEETGCSPARAVEKLRLEAASLLVSQGRLSIDVIAIETGFGDSERMRRAFQRAYGHSPRAMRQLADVRVNIG
ncbi:GlxA family transcriptional regulator [Sphingomonas faeni]|uniref:GlxA family transcriptional regulator n=1 Tax=Sphingomonas faeni TaxID=185950 RepID=UPI0033638009